MNRYQVVTLALAFLVTACLIGVGISIGENSPLGILGCIVAAFALMGFGFSYKRKHMR
ncbi:YlaF family protein [Brevibacillus sp. GCM10020057]|uniref:YlaF family protein n=1 Tax=Brevibacillus sp. GCM10020057 TaxID=3317327 RepID=UPI00362EF8B6